MEPKIRLKGFSDEWTMRKLGSFGSVAMCKRIFKDQTSPIGDVPFYKIGTFGSSPDAYISRELFLDYKSRFSFPLKGDILISAAGTIGRVVEYLGEDAYFQDSNIVWLNHNDEIENVFLKYLYTIIKWKGLEGATIKRLYNNIILDTEIYNPSKEEQVKIGEYFQHLDSLIQATSKKIESLKQVKAASLQSMFPQNGERAPRIRFNGFDGDWNRIKLEDLYDFHKGKGLSKEKLAARGIYDCILYGELFTKFDFEVKSSLSKTNIYEGYPSKSGDIIMPGSTTTSGIDLAKAVHIPYDGVLYGGDIIILRPKNKAQVDSYFMSTQISCINREQIATVAQGITIVHLHASNIAGLYYLFPSIKEQEAIASYFRNIENQIQLNSQRLEKLQQIKSACLDNMFV